MGGAFANLRHWVDLKHRLEWLLPAHCLTCQKECGGPRWLCPACLAAISFNPAPCQGCALPGHLLGWCPPCLSLKASSDPPPIDRCFSPLWYEGVVAQLIKKWKFEGATELTEFLVHTGGPPPTWALQVDWLVPVPMTWRKRLKRGYNQSHLLADALYSQYCPIESKVVHALSSVGTAATQHKLNRRDRSNNAVHRFAVNRSPHQKRVLLVDDVMTTGATLAAAARALKQAGASTVYAWSLSRTA